MDELKRKTEIKDEKGIKMELEISKLFLLLYSYFFEVFLD